MVEGWGGGLNQRGGRGCSFRQPPPGKGKPNCIKIEILDLELNTKTIYNSIKEAARDLKISHVSIINYF